jgi:hypothetical protein
VSDPPAVGFCPGCGSTLADPGAFLQEYWTGADRQFVIWCPSCNLTCTITLGPLTATEPEH